MSKNVRAIIVYGNDTTLHIQMKKWDGTTASYIEFDMTTVKCLRVNLICEKHGTVIPLEYEIDETYNNILNCPINYELLHTGTSYGLVVEGVDENDANFRFEMLPKELFLVVSNTSGLKITDSLDVEGRVGWGINTGGDLTDYYTKEETDELLSHKASYTDVENKQDTLVSGENIKTINNISLLGSGNINIGGGGVNVQSDWNETDDTNPAYIQNKPDLGEYVTKTELSNATYVTANDLSAYASISYVTDELNTKQNTLESGVNIKTINNLSLLGSGNINIEGGGGIAYQVQSDWIDNNPLSYAYILNKPDLSAYATVSYVTNEVVNIEQVLATSLADFSTEIGYIKDDLNSYVTYTYLNSKNYLQSSDLNNYYTKSETEQKIADEISYIDLSSYVTKSDLSSAGYLTSSALTDYPTFTDISNMSYITINDVPQPDLSSYVTKSELENASYATESYVTNEINALGIPGIIKTKNGSNSDIYVAYHNKNKNLNNIDYLGFVLAEIEFGNPECAQKSITFGQNCSTKKGDAPYSISGGYGVNVKGQCSAAFGSSNETNAHANFAAGQNIITRNRFEAGFCKFNNSITDRTLFSIGYGSSTNDRKNAFELTQNGYAYITYNDSYTFCLQDFITYTYNNIGSGGGGTQVQSDWNETDNTSAAYIQNKPDLSNYTTVSDISAMSYVTSTDLSSASYVTSGDLTYYASSSTAGIKIEVVSAMPAQPVANTIYLVQAS